MKPINIGNDTGPLGRKLARMSYSAVKRAVDGVTPDVEATIYWGTTTIYRTQSVSEIIDALQEDMSEWLPLW